MSGSNFSWGVRDEPWLAGQNLADRADQTGNVLDTIQYFVVLIAEDDVAVLSHDFDDQLFAAQITQLIQVFQFKNDDSFQTRLGNGDDTRILNMLSKQHTEIWRGHGAWFIVARQIDERQGSACRETETLLPVFVFNRAEQLVRFRLGDFGQPTVYEIVL